MEGNGKRDWAAWHQKANDGLLQQAEIISEAPPEMDSALIVQSLGQCMITCTVVLGMAIESGAERIIHAMDSLQRSRAFGG